MQKSTKTALVILSVTGALFATATLADMGPGKRMGMGGEMLMDRFDEIDADKDGKITPAELAAHRQARFAAADANSDGKLDAGELTAFHAARMAERMEARTTRMMKWLDANGDGALSADEMPDGPEPDRLARLDSDGDGAISKEEAQAAAERMAGHKHRRGMQSDD